ncbi:MAG: hypothetical protein ABR615_02570 [Pseudonocardiaceae bacterium]
MADHVMVGGGVYLAAPRAPFQLFIAGACTAPVGGITGSPGRAAAKAALIWRRRSGC